MDNTALFFRHVAQTSGSPLALPVRRAKGSYIYDEGGKPYIDLIAGISVANVGHGNARVLRAIRAQAEAYLHVMVYGECIENPQVAYAARLAGLLPASLNSVYFTNSGAEAIEGAMKLAKRATGRTEIIAFQESYHGSTQGALSLIGSEYWRNAFRPLLPGIHHLPYNDPAVFGRIGPHTAAVVLEPVQAERGVYSPDPAWLKELRLRCTEAGALLVLDEVQTGFGRCGSLWAFSDYGIVPDILVLGKALGGGMPLGAFIAARELTGLFTRDPVLGHITTFGGHPVCCAAGEAALGFLLEKNLPAKVAAKEGLFRKLLRHPSIRAIRSRGLLMALDLGSAERCKSVVARALERGVLTDWFLFAPHCLRIAPPLTIAPAEIRKACTALLESMEG